MIDTGLLKYIPKKLHDGIEVLEKTYDGYETVLKKDWLWDGNNSMVTSETVKELKQDINTKRVRYEKGSWEKLFGRE